MNDRTFRPAPWMRSLGRLLIAALVVAAGAAPSLGQDTGRPSSAASIAVGEAWRVRSTRLREDREIRVYLPSSYAGSRQRFPVIYALDGEGTGPLTASAVRFMAGYSAIPQMPEALVVGVPNTDRNRDMPIPPEYGHGREDDFLAFLADELIPAVERRYRTQPLRILVGHSQGGLFAIYAMTARPAVFQWYLPLDAPLSGFPEVQGLMEKATEMISKNPGTRGRLVTVENLYGWKRDWPSLSEAASKGFITDRVEITDETHETMAYKGIYEGLKRLFRDYAPDLIRDNKGNPTLPALEERYRALSEAYGYQVDIPKQVLLMSAIRNTAMQHGIEAVELVKRAAALYGESTETQRILADAEAAVKKGSDPRLEEWANLPPPGAEQLKPFLGTWERMTGDGARRLVTFEVKDGVGRAENFVTPPSGESFQLEIAFVRVLEGRTVQWGERNGRGPGVTVYTAKLTDEGTLAGTAEAVGFIRSRPPEEFTFKRGSRRRP